MKKFHRVKPASLSTWVASLALFLLSHDSCHAQESSTTPRGVYLVKIPGKPEGATVKRTYFSNPFPQEIRFSGTPEEINGAQISFSVGSHNDLAIPNRQHYLYVIDGSGAGFITDIVSFQEDDITCAADLTNWITPFTTRVSIFTHSRLINTFGATNEVGLGSGTSAELADNIVIFDSATQQEAIYYYHSTRNRWERDGVEADAGSTIIPYPNGLYVVRRTTGNLLVELSGQVNFAPLLLPVRTGLNVFTLPINLNVSPSSWISSDGDFPVIKGANTNSADLLTFYDPLTSASSGPFYFPDTPGATWREVGVNNSTAPTDKLDLLSTLVVQRKGPPGFIRANSTSEFETVPFTPAAPEPLATPITVDFTNSLLGLPTAGITFTVQSSSDLQNWIALDDAVFFPSANATINVNQSQARQFYRLIIEQPF